MLYLSSRLDEVKGELSECQSREVRSQEELERVKGDLEGRGTVAKTMEAELQRKWKALEQAKGREDKLIQKLQQVSTDCNEGAVGIIIAPVTLEPTHPYTHPFLHSTTHSCTHPPTPTLTHQWPTLTFTCPPLHSPLSPYTIQEKYEVLTGGSKPASINRVFLLYNYAVSELLRLLAVIALARWLS